MNHPKYCEAFRCAFGQKQNIPECLRRIAGLTLLIGKHTLHLSGNFFPSVKKLAN